MKLIVSALTCATLTLASQANAGVQTLRGSDTLAGLVTDAIVQAGLSDKLSYQGGGSGLGETALATKQQGIAPMSRAFKADMTATARAAGVNPVEHVIALDGLGIWVNQANTLPSVTLQNLRDIFGCKVTRWEQLPGSGRTGELKALRRDDNSGTTDTFKSLVGVKEFGACVKIIVGTGTEDIANETARDPDSIGYAGLSATRPTNRHLAVAKDSNSRAVLPTVANVRDFSYPLARQLYVYEAAGSLTPNAAETELLNKLTDRSFLEPIVQDHDFITIN